MSAHGECLQCGEAQESVKANRLGCAVMDYEGECQEDWPRHRWADWTDAELSRMHIRPQFMDQYRRTNVAEFQLIDCTHQGQEHTPWDGDPHDGPPPYICVRCWADTRTGNLDAEATP